MTETLWSKNSYRLYLLIVLALSLIVAFLLIPYYGSFDISKEFAIAINIATIFAFIFFIYYYRNKVETRYLRYMKIIFENLSESDVTCSHLTLSFNYQGKYYSFKGPVYFFYPYNFFKGGADFFLIDHSKEGKEKYRTFTLPVKMNFLIPDAPSDKAIQEWRKYFFP